MNKLWAELAAMRKNKLFFPILSLILSLTLFSKAKASETLVISDIDDTLKISHVLSRLDSLENSIKIWNVFQGMPEVFNALAETVNVEFYYVSNAPESLMYEMHQGFLGYNGFPRGELLLNPDVLGGNHKLQTISKLLLEQRPKLVLLVGDNGEEDAKIYRQIRELFPNIKFETYIHEVYSSKNRSELGKEKAPGQYGFATAGELAYLWSKLNFIPEGKLKYIVRSQIDVWKKQSPSEEDGELVFPAWQDCRGYQSPIAESAGLLAEFKNWVQNRCSLGAQ